MPDTDGGLGGDTLEQRGALPCRSLRGLLRDRSGGLREEALHRRGDGGGLVGVGKSGHARTLEQVAR